jgi:hypothetical protein
MTRILNWLERRLNKDRVPVSTSAPKPVTA